MSFSNISFILHKPQLSENIGACARALKNFNFNKLILINPKPIFPNDKIIATSVGAKDVIKKSKVYDDIEPAVKNIDYLIATTSRFRNKNLKHIQLNDLKKIDFNKRVAFIFGSEASGLSNNEISYANYSLQIPTNSKFKSLNLSHSLIIVAQIIFNLINTSFKTYTKSKKIKSATKKQVQAMANLCIKNLEDQNFFKQTEKKPIMIENLRSIFYKMDLSEKETRILSSVFASLAKKG
jgi:tRNA/rRNA methyltransferase|tara:strand:+ start:355 stop:1068 length:714 start_codon:yes stop_codon:yes gene_type:complete